jgi:hypothetical protein
MTRSEKTPLKAFWDEVEKRLAACSGEDVRAILREMAYGALPSGRGGFLALLEPPKGTPAEVLWLRGNRCEADALLSDIRNRFPRHRAFQGEMKRAIRQMERSVQ